MRHKKLKLSTVLILGLGLTGLQAQSSLYVKEKTGTQIPLALSNINKLTFPTGNMQINKTDGTSQMYALNSIRYFNFDDLTNVSQITNQETNNILLFPNPVINELQINFQLAEKGVTFIFWGVAILSEQFF